VPEFPKDPDGAQKMTATTSSGPKNPLVLAPMAPSFFPAVSAAPLGALGGPEALP